VQVGDPPREAATSQSLERGLAILSTFTATKPLMGVSDVAREVGLSRSSAHRYIATLAKLGYLEQDRSTRRYRLGPRVYDLGFSAINSMELRQIAAPDLQSLSDATGHTVNMAFLDGADIVYIERCRSTSQGQREIDLNLHVGSRLPAYCTSMGKVLLAGLPPDELETRVARIDFAKRGPNTITARAALLDELALVRERGLAVNNEELAYGLRSIAVPVRGSGGDVVAAINLAVHRSLVSMEDLVVRLAPVLQATGRGISMRAGFRSDAFDDSAGRTERLRPS
jgi:IclR family pca regulon transcriptional regulator